MVEVTLVYPYFRPKNDRSMFRFPPLGLGYMAAYLERHKISVSLVDCTFLSQDEALEKINHSSPEIVGIYSMFSMKKKSMEIAELLEACCEVLVAGGPLPTVNPSDFLKIFDVAVLGEGEETMFQLVQELEGDGVLSNVNGIAYTDQSRVRINPPRSPIEDLDSIPFPARELFDTQSYKRYYSKRFGYTVTTMISSRGCPFNCDFCSRPIFGRQFRTRSAKNIVDEMEEVVSLGYDRISFSDDCFTLDRKRLMDICDEIIRRGLRVDWECLSRVDALDQEVAEKIKGAGCVRTFFGIESGNDSILTMMNKQITTEQVKDAVRIARSSGIQTGGFFILGYPGETEQTVLDTVRFSTTLQLDYLSFTLPYPIPGTPLYERVKDSMIFDDLEEPRHPHLMGHRLLYRSQFSEMKLKFALLKASIQYRLRKHLGHRVYRFLGWPFEWLTDIMFRTMR